MTVIVSTQGEGYSTRSHPINESAKAHFVERSEIMGDGDTGSKETGNDGDEEDGSSVESSQFDSDRNQSRHSKTGDHRTYRLN